MADALPVLLVHGAWHGGWAWDDLTPLLRERGHTVTTVDLPSGGGTGDLAADAAVIRAALDAIDGPAIVAAHSYGGIPTTEATAGRDDVAHLVYVCAFLLDTGESLLGALQGEIPDWIAVDGGAGTSSVPDPVTVFYPDVDPGKAAAATAKVTTQTLSSFGDALTGAGWHDSPSTYIACTQDRAIPYPAQQAMSQRAGTVHTLESSHSPFLSHTAEVAEIISGV